MAATAQASCVKPPVILQLFSMSGAAGKSLRSPRCSAESPNQVKYLMKLVLLAAPVLLLLPNASQAQRCGSNPASRLMVSLIMSDRAASESRGLYLNVQVCLRSIRSLTRGGRLKDRTTMKTMLCVNIPTQHLCHLPTWYKYSMSRSLFCHR